MHIGEKLPEIKIEVFDPNNKDIKTVSSSDYKGKWLVLFFYPADFTFVCPTELQDLAKYYSDFVKEDAEVCSISTDTVYTHKAWIETEKLLSDVKYLMGADRNGNISKIFGFFDVESGNSHRGTVIVDPDGVIRAMEVVDGNIGRNAKELLRRVRALKFVREHKGEVCPANWEEGMKTLKKSINIVGRVHESLK